MRDRAAEYGVSNVGLAMIYNGHRVPKPGRGYWTKLEAGKKITTTIIREVDDPTLNRAEIRSGRLQLPMAAREVITRGKAERKAAKSVLRAQTTLH